MNALVNFDFEDNLVRMIEHNGEPWFVGKDVCHVLGISKYRDALSRLDKDEGCPLVVDTLGGKQEMMSVNEPGLYRLVFKSRKPEAKRFKRWLAHEVLPQIRKTGKYAPSPDAITAENVDAPLMAKVEAVRVATRLFGRARAQSLWAKLGLPAVPPAPATDAMSEARACLRVLLEYQPEGAEHKTVRTLILDAVDGNTNAELLLRCDGIRVSEDGEGFLVANLSPGLFKIYQDTEWHEQGWRLVLRRFRGANPGGTVRASFANRQTRATWLPLDVLDENHPTS